MQGLKWILITWLVIFILAVVVKIKTFFYILPIVTIALIVMLGYVTFTLLLRTKQPKKETKPKNK